MSSACSAAEVTLSSAAGKGLRYEVQVPWEEVRLEPVTEGGKAYVRVSIPGWSTTSEAGSPELPLLAETIGVPFGSAVRVQVEPGSTHTVALPAPVLPAPTQVVEWVPPGVSGETPAGATGMAGLPAPELVVEEDAAIYGGQAVYPGVLTQVVGDGVLRQQRIVGIVAYPLQYDPAAGELTVYESLTVLVSFEGGSGAPAEGVPAESAAYENLLRGRLLNYETARGWRQRVAPPVPGGEESGSADAEADSAEVTEAGIEAVAWTPPVPGWRVKVREDGFYKLTYDELEAAGLSVSSLDPRTLQLYHLGSEMAIHVAGEEEGSFDRDPGDHVLFYGQAVDDKYTVDSVYWLTYGQGNGLRMTTRDATPGTAATPASYAARRHLETNVWYQPGAPGDEHLERWLWDYLYPPSRPSRSFTLPLAAPDVGNPATLTVAIMGGLAVQAIDLDHHVQVSLNGEQVGDAWWDGITWQVLEMPVAAGVLVAGDNTVQVVAPNDTGVGYDYFLTDWIELEFANAFVAENDELAFGYGAIGSWKFRVSGLSGAQVTAYDVTNPWAVVRLEGLVVNQVDETYVAEFEDAVAAPTHYRALADAAYRTVQSIEEDTASDLKSTANGADYIVITHQAFWSQAQNLSDHRASQGLRAMVVDVQDVYDEFSFGQVGAAPIHEFLAYAYAHWQGPAPSYVVLVGDGNYDPKNYAGSGPVSYVPPYLAPVDPWLGETAADNRYVTVAGTDTMPDMMLGRLAVNSVDEATAFVEKIIAYEESPEVGDWQTHVLVVADNPDGAGYFDQMSDGMLDCCVPDSYLEERVYYGVTHTTVTDARTAILGGINDGMLIVNYIGHAAPSQWAEEGLFKASDVAGLTNGARLPVMLPMTCWDGYYVNPTPRLGTNATGEVVTRAEGKGAVASWSPTGLGVATGHDNLDRGFLEAVLMEGRNTVGEGTIGGKLELFSTGANLDLLDTYLLFGDPALQIPIIETDLQVDKTVEPVGQVSPGDILTYTLTFTNSGSNLAHSVVLSDVLPLVLIDAEVLYESPAVLGQVPGERHIWEIEDLEPGAGGEIQLRVTVDPAAGAGTIVNTAELRSDEPDLEPSDNSASVSNEIILPDLWVEKSVSPGGQVEPGTVLTYTLTFGNAGLGIAHGVALTDIVPGLLVDPVVIAVSDEVSGPRPGVTFAWGIDDLEPGSEGEIRLRATVDPTAEEGTIVNEVEVRASEVDAEPADNSDSVSNEISVDYYIYLPLVIKGVP